MQNISIQNARDLRHDARVVVESLLGRKLSEEEQVAVTAFPVHPAPPEEERKIAASRLAEDLEAMAESAKRVPEDEMEALIDEAMGQVRVWGGP
jgi:hypothetical protein